MQTPPAPKESSFVHSNHSNHSDYTEHTTGGDDVYQGGLLHVRRDSVRLSDGSSAYREYIKHPGAVMVLAFPTPNTVLLVRQYRYPQQRHHIELPAGKIDPNEPPLIAAQRELLEETGYHAAHWRTLHALVPTVAYSTEKVHLFVAEQLTFQGRKPDPGEFLDVLEWPWAQAVAAVQSGEINDTVGHAILWWHCFGHLVGQPAPAPEGR